MAFIRGNLSGRIKKESEKKLGLSDYWKVGKDSLREHTHRCFHLPLYEGSTQFYEGTLHSFRY